jgi:hypothetical protein
MELIETKICTSKRASHSIGKILSEQPALLFCDIHADAGLEFDCEFICGWQRQTIVLKIFSDSPKIKFYFPNLK